MGASWIHGIGPGVQGLSEWDGEYNPIWEIVEENDIETVFTYVDDDETDGLYFWYNSTRLTDSQIGGYFEGPINYFESRLKSSNINDSVGDVMKGYNYGNTLD